MGQEDASKMRVGRCGSCGLEILFWGDDEEIVKCVGCGSEHEVERGEAVDLRSGKTSEVAWLVLVDKGRAGRTSEN